MLAPSFRWKQRKLLSSWLTKRRKKKTFGVPWHCLVFDRNLSKPKQTCLTRPSKDWRRSCKSGWGAAEVSVSTEIARVICRSGNYTTGLLSLVRVTTFCLFRKWMRDPHCTPPGSKPLIAVLKAAFVKSGVQELIFPPVVGTLLWTCILIQMTHKITLPKKQIYI